MGKTAIPACLFPAVYEVWGKDNYVYSTENYSI